ncbi:carboxylesterase 5A [Folsomia candida]|uniref:carboxylesterase 5A n=1 Tax=Folsomia candida TaxID=158441 RepID=UPI0016055213|nr:carboxylesterase 5A [Folsomia candida]
MTPAEDPVRGNLALPVLINITGGSFYRWYGGMFAGTGLLDRDIILVSINYRLNAFGFFTLDINESPGNLGLLDQLWALSWVKRNIQHFGGNPDMITIYGQSAGAASVGYLMDTNLTRGLFHRAIQSSELKDYPTGTIEILISSFLKEMRLPDSFTGVAPFISDIYSAFYFKAPALSKAKSHAQLGWDTFLYSHEYFNP